MALAPPLHHSADCLEEASKVPPPCGQRSCGKQTEASSERPSFQIVAFARSTSRYNSPELSRKRSLEGARESSWPRTRTRGRVEAKKESKAELLARCVAEGEPLRLEDVDPAYWAWEEWWRGRRPESGSPQAFEAPGVPAVPVPSLGE
jgi:hypothetical protein